MSGKSRCVHIDRFSLGAINFHTSGTDLTNFIKTLCQVGRICYSLLDEIKGMETGTIFSVGERTETKVQLSDGNFIIYACLF